MGRYSKEGGPSVVIATRVGPVTLEAIDKARGSRTRTAWLDLAIVRALMEQGPDAPFPVKDHEHSQGRRAGTRYVKGEAGLIRRRFFCVDYPSCGWVSEWL